MDRIPKNVMDAMSVLASADQDTVVHVQQDVGDEKLYFETDIGLNCRMNCAMNSVQATIHQFCQHLAKGDLLSYDEGYGIGA